MSGAKVPEHAVRIETATEVARRVMPFYGPEEAPSRAVDIRDDQIRRALGFALIGEAEMPRECLRRVRDVLAAIGGAL